MRRPGRAMTYNRQLWKAIIFFGCQNMPSRLHVCPVKVSTLFEQSGSKLEGLSESLLWEG
jgi:hypothetical protein